MANLDLDLVRHALALARQNGYAEVEIAAGENSFAASLMPGAISQALTTVQDDPAPDPPDVLEIKATLVGYFRNLQPPLKIGSIVNEGDHVGIIAALGIPNEIESAVTGEVCEILVEEGQPVEFGQVIARIRP